MTIEEIKKSFPEHQLEVRENDHGSYIDVWLGRGIFVSVHPNENNVVRMQVGGDLVVLEGVKNIEDLNKLGELINGKKQRK